ncbi:MAG TPA: ribonuclease HII, partial [Candidatus Gracilibacteria bacterium]|nr:ribonuclease HII [Candidatus Gracilibacteria bacterium]
MAFLSFRKIFEKGGGLPDAFLNGGESFVCGMDEVGRGPWAGPLLACAFMMPKAMKLGGLKDSKQLSAEKREKFYRVLVLKGWHGLGAATVEEIDSVGLTGAMKLAYMRALENLLTMNGGVKPAYLLIDGRDKMDLGYPSKSIIKGDERVRHIACASIIAKVERDRIMKEMAKKFPQYGFDLHKG